MNTLNKNEQDKKTVYKTVKLPDAESHEECEGKVFSLYFSLTGFSFLNVMFPVSTVNIHSFWYFDKLILSWWGLSVDVTFLISIWSFKIVEFFYTILWLLQI